MNEGLITIREFFLGAAAAGGVFVVFMGALLLAMAWTQESKLEKEGIRKQEASYLMWHEECADLREAAIQRWREKQKQ